MGNFIVYGRMVTENDGVEVEWGGGDYAIIVAGWSVIHLLRVGWRNFFSSCAVVSVFSSGRE